MKYLASHEYKTRGTLGFPFEYHHLTQTHPRYEMPFHWHSEYELIYIVDGEFILTINDKSYNLKKGDSALILDGIIHGGHGKEAIYECIVFDYIHICQKNYVEFSSTIDFFQKMESPIIFSENPTESRKKVEELFEIFRTKKINDFSKLQIFGCIFSITGIVLENNLCEADISNKKDKNIYRLKGVLSYIKQHYSENITLSELAENAGLNEKYLCSLFKQLTGKTPIDYLIYYRIQCACEQLIFTNLTITEIALSCGFNDISYFVKQFKKLKNTTPFKYRQQN